MYIVREKATRKLIHVNPAPVSQQLEGTDIYYQLDPENMEVGHAELAEVPEYFDIRSDGTIVPWTLERQIKERVKLLPPELKAVGDQVVEKTLTEKVADGVIQLKPTEKLVDDTIQQKSITEQVADGTVQLSPTQIIDGEQIRQMTEGEQAAAGLIKLDPRMKLVGKTIVPKTSRELVRDKLVSLASDEKVQGDDVIKLTPRQMLTEGRHDLQRYKDAVLERYAQVSLAARQKSVPDYQLLYVAIGVLDSATADRYKKVASEHVRALEQMKQAIAKASTADEVDSVAALGDWPSPSPSRTNSSVGGTGTVS
jgi:hypothetical protein